MWDHVSFRNPATEFRFVTVIIDAHNGECRYSPLDKLLRFRSLVTDFGGACPIETPSRSLSLDMNALENRGVFLRRDNCDSFDASIKESLGRRARLPLPPG
jgi:hypothetical protein